MIKDLGAKDSIVLFPGHEQQMCLATFCLTDTLMRVYVSSGYGASLLCLQLPIYPHVTGWPQDVQAITIQRKVLVLLAFSLRDICAEQSFHRVKAHVARDMRFEPTSHLS